MTESTNPHQSKRPNEPTIGHLISHARQSAGLSLNALAVRAGLPKSTVHKLELDIAQNPSPITLAAVAQALNLNLADVYAAAGYEAPSQLPKPRTRTLVPGRR